MPTLLVADLLYLSIESHVQGRGDPAAKTHRELVDADLVVYEDGADVDTPGG